MQQFLIDFSLHHSYLVYGLLILFACAEGPILSMFFGVLLKFGYFSFIPVYAALMIGDLIGDVIWYYIGYRFGHSFIQRFGKFFNITEAGVTKVTAIFLKHKHSILLISKVTSGFGLALVTLMTAGMLKISFRYFILINLLGQFVWTGLLLSVGYFFGSLYLSVDTFIGRMSVAVLFIIMFALMWGYKNYLQKKSGETN